VTSTVAPVESVAFEMSPRAHRNHGDGPNRRVMFVCIALLMLLTFVRGLFWVVSFPVWSGDEGAHYSYEQSVATGHGIPVSGRSLNSGATLRLVKNSPVSTERSFPIPPVPTSRWGIIDEQYEGLQSPLYYVVLTPAYWVGRLVGGTVGSFYALRLASLCMAVATIPLVALLARKLFPEHRAVWLLSPAVIAALQIVNVQNSYVDNDSLTMVVATLCLLALIESRGDLRPRKAALFGVALGAALLTKATLGALVPALLIAMAAYAIRRRPPFKSTAIWVAVAGVTAGVMVLPYLLFNIAEYHALSGARAAATLVKPIIGSTPVSFHGAELLTETFVHTLFVGQGLVPPQLVDHYQRLWEWTAALTAAGALGTAAMRRRWNEFAVAAWIVVSIPLGVVTLIVLGFNQSGTEATVVARYLDCLLPLFSILVGYGAVALLGSRAGSLALLVLLVSGSFLEVAGNRSYIVTTYTADAIGNSVPAVEQSYADSLAPLTGLRATASCRVDAVAFDVFGTTNPPSAVLVNGQRTSGPAADGLWDEYSLVKPTKGNIVVRFPSPAVVGTARHFGTLTDAEGRVMVTTSGLPTVRLYCPVKNPQATRFSQLYPTNHPPLSLGTLLAWPESEAWFEAALVAGVAAAMVVRLSNRRGAHTRRSRSTRS
jgi:4-amino-4-deoxy-L-arabinose transferase-like glycosyltransferase